MESLSIKDRYELACNTPNQIYKHLPILYEYALKCDHVTEFGIETVISTYAFLNANPKSGVSSYDLNYHPNFELCSNSCKVSGVRWYPFIGSTTAATIGNTDMLFIDTLHTENQLKTELKLHAHKVKKYLAFHDTETFWENAEMPGERGLKYAIEPFMAEHPEWKEVYRTDINNGLLILERQ